MNPYKAGCPEKGLRSTRLDLLEQEPEYLLLEESLGRLRLEQLPHPYQLRARSLARHIADAPQT